MLSQITAVRAGVGKEEFARLVTAESQFEEQECPSTRQLCELLTETESRLRAEDNNNSSSSMDVEPASSEPTREVLVVASSPLLTPMTPAMPFTQPLPRLRIPVELAGSSRLNSTPTPLLTPSTAPMAPTPSTTTVTTTSAAQTPTTGTIAAAPHGLPISVLMGYRWVRRSYSRSPNDQLVRFLNNGGDDDDDEEEVDTSSLHCN